MGFAALLPSLGLAGAGALSSLFGRGKQPSLKKLPTLNKDQQKLLHHILSGKGMASTAQNPLYQQGIGYLNQILSQDPQMMKQFEAPYMRQFQEQIVPGLAERFAGMGALNSGAFNQSMAQEAGSLSERLASMRAGLGMDAARMGYNYSQLPYQEQMDRNKLGLGTQAFRYVQDPGYEGMGSQLGNVLMRAGGMGLGYGAQSMFGGGGMGGMGMGSSRTLYPPDSIF